MIVACGPSIQRIIANAPESVLSARQAVAEVGFQEMLGYRNVFEGTDLHKGIIKGYTHSEKAQKKVVAEYIRAAKNALIKETTHLNVLIEETRTHLIRITTRTALKLSVEFMSFIRRVVLRAVVEVFIGQFFLSDEDEFKFIDEFMKFQDDLENATAKSAVLPRSIALPLFLLPLKRRRLKLERIISRRLNDALPESGIGFWLAAVLDDEHDFDVIAQFIIGLLFAAHKNPAIGAAQSYLMLFERGTTGQQQICIKEAQTLLSHNFLHSVQETCPTLYRLCSEALRLTAHSIGGLRTATKDFSVGNGYVIPKGSTVALAHIPSSLNTEFWVNPKRLDLDITTNNRSKDLYDNDYTFTVFSHGVHKCPGQKLSMIILPCTVAILLAKYKINLPEKIPPICFERATLAQRAGPVNVELIHRGISS